MTSERDSSIRFSLIIPARNEAAYLPRLLDTVDVARERYAGGADAVEVIVSDNVSTDDTAEIARQRGCRIARVEKRVIAAVRNGGAQVAEGRVFAFVDADMQIHPDTFNAIDRALAPRGGSAVGKVICGSTGTRAERMTLGLAATMAILVPLVWVTGMDTGVVFCRREDFDAVGGYNEERFFAEDVQFLMDLKRLGRSRKQRITRITSVKAIVSTRKFDKHGQWHYLPLMFTFLWSSLFSRNNFERFAQSYWYEDDR